MLLIKLGLQYSAKSAAALVYAFSAHKSYKEKERNSIKNWIPLSFWSPKFTLWLCSSVALA